MIVFLTSSPTIGWAGPLNPANSFLENLRSSLPHPIKCVMVSSFPDDEKITDRMAWELRECFEWADLKFDHYEVLDRRTEALADEMIKNSNFVILCGGHVPTENIFFQQIRLREALKGFSGVVMGISAGSMNSAENVYAPPELEGEALNPNYCDHYNGLGFTDINIMPHFQNMRHAKIDGLYLVKDIMSPQSFNNPIFCLTDGAYLKISSDDVVLYGETYRLRQGRLRKICNDGEYIRISPNGKMHKL